MVHDSVDDLLVAFGGAGLQAQAPGQELVTLAVEDFGIHGNLAVGGRHDEAQAWALLLGLHVLHPE